MLNSKNMYAPKAVVEKAVNIYRIAEPDWK